MTIFSLFKQHRESSKVNKAREAQQLAAERLANACANVYYAEQMLTFYRGQIAKVDHEVDFWLYAELKQKELDTAAELARYIMVVEERTAQLQARQENA